MGGAPTSPCAAALHAQPSPFLRAALSCLRPPLLTHMLATEALAKLLEGPGQWLG